MALPHSSSFCRSGPSSSPSSRGSYKIQPRPRTLGRYVRSLAQESDYERSIRSNCVRWTRNRAFHLPIPILETPACSQDSFLYHNRVPKEWCSHSTKTPLSTAWSKPKSANGLESWRKRPQSHSDQGRGRTRKEFVTRTSIQMRLGLTPQRCLDRIIRG